MRKSHKLTDQQKIDIVDSYLVGEKENCHTLARKYRVHPNSIASILKKRNVKIRNNPSKMSRKYTLNESYFDVIDTEGKAYFLGFIYADGYNYVPKSKISIGLQERDHDILDKFNEEIKSNKPLYLHMRSKKNPKWQNACYLEMFSEKISKQLIYLGCVQAKSFKIRLPDEEKLPKHLLKHFIRGYFDGDGSLGLYTHGDRPSLDIGCKIASCNDFCQDLAKVILDELNIKSYIYLEKGKHPDFRCMRVGCTNEKKIKFLDWIYKDSTIYLNRKYSKYLECKNYMDAKNES